MTQSRAMLYALGAFFFFVLYDVAVKLGREAGLTPPLIMAAVGAVGVMAIAGQAFAKKDMAALRPKKFHALALICACSVASRYSNITAVKYLPLTVFYTVVFTMPLVIAVLSRLLKHETLTPTKIACVVAGFLGVLLAVAPRLTMEGEAIGYLATLSGVFFFAIFTLTMRRMSQTETVRSTQFVASLAIGTAGFVGVFLHPPLMPTAHTLALLFAAGVAATVGSIFYNVALQNTLSTNVAQLHYTQIVSGALFGYVIWGDVPTWNLVVGSVIIIASGIIVAAQAHKSQSIARDTMTNGTSV